ncbi:MAG TPA: DUF2267 domain-containing protein [Clostridia bacterium]|nr:DUF2267 domain-containing protein [Clostridia bacterium]
MTFDEFVGEVQNRARLGTMGDAVRAIRCTLAVLSQRLAGGEVKDLASQLPEEIGFYLLHAEAGQGARFSADEFVNRVSACERADKPEAIFHVRAVLEVLHEAVSAGQFNHVVAQLPSEYKPLFTAGSTGKMRSITPRSKAATASKRREVGTQKTRISRGRAGGREVEEEVQAEQPRSARIARRAAGPWHVGR